MIQILKAQNEFNRNIFMFKGKLAKNSITVLN